MTPDNCDLAVKIGKIIFAATVVVTFFNLGQMMRL